MKYINPINCMLLGSTPHIWLLLYFNKKVNGMQPETHTYIYQKIVFDIQKLQV